MLSGNLKKTNSPESLKQTHRAMLAYLEDEYEEAEEDGDKPAFKVPQDYVLNVEMAEGKDYSEAVSVSVIPDIDKEGDYVISRLEWGRP